jgi:hypothetical protein
MQGGPLNVRQKWVTSLCMSDANHHVSEWKKTMSNLGEHMHMKQNLTEQWQNEATTWGCLRDIRFTFPNKENSDFPFPGNERKVMQQV